jgi:hypothetical protein
MVEPPGIMAHSDASIASDSTSTASMAPRLSVQRGDTSRIAFQRLFARLCGDSVMKSVRVTTAKAAMAKISK